MDRRPRRGRRTVLVVAVVVLGVAAAARLIIVNMDGGDGPAAPTVQPPVAATVTPPAKPPAKAKAAAPRESAKTPAPATAMATPQPARKPVTTPARPPAPIPAPVPGTVTTSRLPASAPATGQVAAGLALLQGNRPVEARRVLTGALVAGGLSPADAEFLRETLRSLNRRLVFSPEIVPDDPFVIAYVVQPGDQLGGIVRAKSLAVDWRFIMRINNMRSERHLRAGQRLKLVTGPFHAVVSKNDYRMDLFMGSGDAAVYVTSLPVGLGAYDSTPVGRFRVRPGSKLQNPAWANPRTGERFGADDPSNPIGEHWIGLEGVDDATRDMDGYGIHGTIEPQSVGAQASMGCIRMLPDDVALVYEMLTDASTVEIRP